MTSSVADGSSASPPSRGRGRPRLLDPDAIVAAGLAILDRDGIDGLTMAAVAGELGVSVATPYTYYGSKDSLCNDIVDQLIGGVAARASDLDGLARARELIRELHCELLAHPAVAQLLATRTVTGPGAAHGQEILLAAFVQAGWSARDCVVGYRTLLSYLLGFSQRRISFERDPAAELSRRDELEALSRDRFPTLHRMLPELDAHMSMDDFDRGLDHLLSGFGAP
ncbi:MAG TPA: TetR/AcrR family transcriptional regulator [Pseudonocardia sp.]|nr:TetR/AcrR family transcriptional regulator [Pseudonocardia sp.]